MKDMKKRPYIKPVVEVVVVSSQMLASSPPTGGGNGVIGGGGNGSANGDGTDQLSNKRRGTWGNLWE
jgi:hypothetical protein